MPLRALLHAPLPYLTFATFIVLDVQQIPLSNERSPLFDGPSFFVIILTLVQSSRTGDLYNYSCFDLLQKIWHFQCIYLQFLRTYIEK